MADTPTVESYTPQTFPRDWGQEVFIAETPHYLGKILHMHAGTKGGLQYHVDKDETFHLWSGRAWVRTVVDGQIVQTLMMSGESFHVPPGAIHQVEAITPCTFFETSTPHYNDRVHVEDQFGLPEAGGLPTTR